MSAASLYPSGNLSERGSDSRLQSIRESDWLRIGAGGALLTGALLLLTGNRRSGLLVTVAGAALAMLQEQELVSQWWNALPGYLDGAQKMISQVQETVDDLSAKREKVMEILGR